MVKGEGRVVSETVASVVDFWQTDVIEEGNAVVIETIYWVSMRFDECIGVDFFSRGWQCTRKGGTFKLPVEFLADSWDTEVLLDESKIEVKFENHTRLEDEGAKVEPVM
jgi:hypothetical protein